MSLGSCPQSFQNLFIVFQEDDALKARWRNPRSLTFPPSNPVTSRKHSLTGRAAARNTKILHRQPRHARKLMLMCFPPLEGITGSAHPMTLRYRCISDCWCVTAAGERRKSRSKGVPLAAAGRTGAATLLLLFSRASRAMWFVARVSNILRAAAH